MQFSNLHKELCDLHDLAVLKLTGEDVDLLENSELKALCRCRDLSEELSDAIFDVATAFYKNKIGVR